MSRLRKLNKAKRIKASFDRPSLLVIRQLAKRHGWSLSKAVNHFVRIGISLSLDWA